LTENPLIGQTLGGYQIEKQLGAGGMGAVYKATQLSLGRPVALKVLSGQLSDDAEFVQRFINEGRAIASLDHPNIVPVYEAGEVEFQGKNCLFLAMRLVRGGSLRDFLLRRGKLTPRQALFLLKQAAAGLDAAHKQGIIHRDIKPANLLLEPGGPGDAGPRVYLADFGIAKRNDGSDSGQTRTGIFIGTPEYMAPEQLQGDSATTASDIYALTDVLYEMLSGKSPYTGNTPAMVIYRKLSEPIPVFNAAAQGLPSAIDAVLARGMALNPAERFASGQELVDAFAAALRQTDAPAAPAPVAPAPIHSAPTQVGTPPAVIPPMQREGGAVVPPINSGPTINQVNPNAQPLPPAPRSYDSYPSGQERRPARDQAADYDRPSASSAYRDDADYPPRSNRSAYRDEDRYDDRDDSYRRSRYRDEEQYDDRRAPASRSRYRDVDEYDRRAPVSRSRYRDEEQYDGRPYGSRVEPRRYGVGGVVWVILILLLVAIVAGYLIARNLLSDDQPGPFQPLNPTAMVNGTSQPGVIQPTPLPGQPTAPPLPPTQPAPPVEQPTAESPTEPPIEEQPTEEQPTEEPSPEPPTEEPSVEPVTFPEGEINQVLQNAGGTFGVVVVDGQQGELYRSNDQQAISAGDMIKLPLVLLAYNQASQGALSLDTQVALEEADRAPQSSQLANQPVGTSLSIQELSTYLLRYSDQTAGNMLIRALGGFDSVNQGFQELELKSVQLNQLLGATSDPQSKPNTLSAADLALLMNKFLRNELMNGEQTQQVLAMIAQSDDQPVLSSQLPQGPTVYQLSSANADPADPSRNSVGVVVLPNGRSYSIVALSQGIADSAQSGNALGQVSRLVYDFEAGLE
jgi:serine/threonine protein kinase/beta-lactamase class A